MCVSEEFRLLRVASQTDWSKQGLRHQYRKMKLARFIYSFICSVSCVGGEAAAPCLCFKQKKQAMRHHAIQLSISGLSRDGAQNTFNIVNNNINATVAQEMVSQESERKQTMVTFCIRILCIYVPE